MKRARRFVRLVGASLACVTFSVFAVGCADPSAVGRFASVARTAGESFSAIADDFPESCTRRERYRLLVGWQSDLDALEEETARSCARYVKSAPRLVGAHRVLVRYLAALGEFSAGGLVSYDDSLDELAGAVERSDMLDENDIEAVKRISAVLMDAAGGKWRRKQLNSVIEQTNPDVQILTSTLRGIISVDYAQLLDDEREAARKFYLGKIRTHGDDEPLTALLVYEKWQKEDEIIDGKRKAAEAYVKVLDKIAKGHQDLFDRRDALDSRDARRLVLEHVNAIEELLIEVRSAF